MQDVALAFLMTILNVLGVSHDPQDFLRDWKIEKSWEVTGEHFVLDASSDSIPAQCKAAPGSYLLFPQIVHSAHEISADGRLIKKVGDPSFKNATPFYQQAYISCDDIAGATTLRWQVLSYSKFFSRISSAPAIVSSPSWSLFFNVGSNIIAGGSLIILAIFSFMIYYGRVSNALTYSVSFGSFILAFYFLNVANEYVGITLSMIISHKFADISLWLGGILFLNAFRVDGFLRKDVFYAFSLSSAVGSAIIALGKSGDQVQFGTVIPMVPCVLCCLNIAYNICQNILLKGVSSGYLLKFCSITAFTICGVNDIFHVMGAIGGVYLLPIGIVFGVLGLSVAVNQEIENTYAERDGLLKTLEDKVAEKTRDLQSTLASLQGAQAELVHSAKLASLGTLSAGIAHEINNSINYVSGALLPLERRVMASAQESDKVLFGKLFAAIKEGTSLTVEIVRSLRTFTGLNQASLKEVLLKDVFTSVMTILKSKTTGVTVVYELEENLTLFGNLVGLNQMIMNLITNALDVMPSSGAQLTLMAYSEKEFVVIEVADNGSGMIAEVQRKVFDPFFTTKEVGKGTGLGLHIVQKEIERHHGKITLWSEVGQGTRFTIMLPKNAVSDREAS